MTENPYGISDGVCFSLDAFVILFSLPKLFLVRILSDKIINLTLSSNQMLYELFVRVKIGGSELGV